MIRKLQASSGAVLLSSIAAFSFCGCTSCGEEKQKENTASASSSAQAAAREHASPEGSAARRPFRLRWDGGPGHRMFRKPRDGGLGGEGAPSEPSLPTP